METKRRILPPMYLAACLVIAVGLHVVLPIYLFTPLALRIGGGVLIVLGIALSATAAGSFTRAGTPVIPFERSTVLVTGGWYRVTRNPMYLGMLLSLVGAGVALGSVGALLPVPVFVWIIQTQFIHGEERFLEEIFGQPYRDFKARVRRWI